jgi:hypothetical protein
MFGMGRTLLVVASNPAQAAGKSLRISSSADIGAEVVFFNCSSTLRVAAAYSNSPPFLAV